MEDVWASGDGACGELCPVDFGNIFLRKNGKGPPVRRITWSNNSFMSSWSEFGSSCNCKSTECDLEKRLANVLLLGGPFSGGAVPIKPLHVGVEDFGRV